jgi:hypothetical protein
MANKKQKKHWTDDLREALLTRGSQPEGEGWMTSAEICKALGRGEKVVLGLIKRMLDNGEMEIFNGNVVAKSGRLVRRVWYRKLT